MTGYYILAVRYQGSTEEAKALLLGPFLTKEDADKNAEKAAFAYAHGNPIEAMCGLDKFYTGSITTDEPFPRGKYNWLFDGLMIDPSFTLEPIDG